MSLFEDVRTCMYTCSDILFLFYFATAADRIFLAAFSSHLSTVALVKIWTRCPRWNCDRLVETGSEIPLEYSAKPVFVSFRQHFLLL